MTRAQQQFSVEEMGGRYQNLIAQIAVGAHLLSNQRQISTIRLFHVRDYLPGTVRGRLGRMGRRLTRLTDPKRVST